MCVCVCVCACACACVCVRVCVCSEISSHGGIEPVIKLISAEQPAAIECAVSVLINMSADEQLSADIVDFDAIPALICALSSRLVASACLRCILYTISCKLLLWIFVFLCFNGSILVSK